MHKKFIIVILIFGIGIIVTLLGLLWFLQGAGIVHLQPILCITNCKPITGKSSLWQNIGIVFVFAGIMIISACVRYISRESK